MLQRGVLLMVLLILAAASLSVVSIQRFITREDAVYDERLDLLCKTSFEAEGYPTADACAQANKTLRDAGQERDFFKDLLLDDRIYVCMLEHAARGVDMSVCINAYMNLSRFISPEARQPPQPPKPNWIRADVWRDMLQDRDASPSQTPEQSADLAALHYCASNPDVSRYVTDKQYPPTASTRSLHLPEGMASLSYDERVRELAKFGLDLRETHLSIPKEMGVQAQTEALQKDGPVKQAFQRLFTDNDFFACTLNNLLIGGDIGLCFYIYFVRHPDQYHALSWALTSAASETHQTPTESATPQGSGAPSIDSVSTDPAGVLPRRDSSQSVDPMPTGSVGLEYGPFPEVSSDPA
jgi:hypothetical protein